MLRSKMTEILFTGYGSVFFFTRLRKLMCNSEVFIYDGEFFNGRSTNLSPELTVPGRKIHKAHTFIQLPQNFEVRSG